MNPINLLQKYSMPGVVKIKNDHPHQADGRTLSNFPHQINLG